MPSFQARFWPLAVGLAQLFAGLALRAWAFWGVSDVGVRLIDPTERLSSMVFPLVDGNLVDVVTIILLLNLPTILAVLAVYLRYQSPLLGIAVVLCPFLVGFIGSLPSYLALSRYDSHLSVIAGYKDMFYLSGSAAPYSIRYASMTASTTPQYDLTVVQVLPLLAPSASDIFAIASYPYVYFAIVFVAEKMLRQALPVIHLVMAKAKHTISI